MTFTSYHLLLSSPLWLPPILWNPRAHRLLRGCWVYINPLHLAFCFFLSCLQPHCRQSRCTLAPMMLGMLPGLTLVLTLALLPQSYHLGRETPLMRPLLYTHPSLWKSPLLLTRWLCLGISSSLKPSQATCIFTLHLPEVTVLSVPSLGIISSLNRYLSPTTCKGRVAGVGGVLSYKRGKNL